MKIDSPDVRTKTLNIVLAASTEAAPDSQAGPLIQAWLNALDAEDLADMSPDSLAAALIDGFTLAGRRSRDGCQIASLRYADGRGGHATALLILNLDMPSWSIRS